MNTEGKSTEEMREILHMGAKFHVTRVIYEFLSSSRETLVIPKYKGNIN